MAKVNVGDLVCMYRRKKKGMGIVLELTEDIIESAGVENTTFQQVCEDLQAIDNPPGGTLVHKKYMARRDYGERLCRAATRPNLIRTCMLYNSSWARKPKKEFVRIRWFDRPSMYENAQIKEPEEWCPADWVRKV